jgi:FKBP-type peptidyl-prolyl cis-trans isomerase 2
MAEIMQKDFVEILFTGRIKNGEIFDSNIPDDIRKEDSKDEPKPLIICVGKRMILESLDNFLEGKEIGKCYEISLPPEKAFGERKPEMVKIIPLHIYHQHNLQPRAGMTVNFDRMLARVISVSGGRVLTDFNNPLAGKHVHYKLCIKRKVDDTKEKVNAVLAFLTHQSFPIEIKENEKKVIVKVPKGLDKILELFKDRFKEILEFDMECIIGSEETASK